MSKPIYVETIVQSEMEKIWEATQDPKQHEKWDLRFTSISYLPKEEGEPQRFSYKTKIGFGLQIEGWGISSGSKDSEDGTRTSSLHFGTDNKLSIIKEGRGYWQYKPVERGIAFITQYNYDVNFGKFGQWFDRLVFRPLIGWATALSFDVLKRWLETGESPAFQFRRFFLNVGFALRFAFIWIYHGLVPKLIFMHPDEIIPVMRLLPVTIGEAKRLVWLLGAAEVMFGLLWLIYRKRRTIYVLQMILLLLLAIAAAAAEPGAFLEPFNPMMYNFILLCLSAAGWIMCKDVPTAANCKRKR